MADPVVGELTRAILARRPTHALRVAVDGPDAAGKTTMADRLATHLAGQCPTIRVSMTGSTSREGSAIGAATSPPSTTTTRPDRWPPGGSAMAVELVYETHSTTVDNEAGIATGWLPGRLSATGRNQARQLGLRRRDGGVAAIFSSDLRRAVETAEIAFSGSGIPVHADRRLRECDYGDLNGAPVARLATERRHRVHEPFPGGESYQQVVDRTRSFLSDLVRDWDGHRVVVVAHTANLWALEILVHGRSLDELVDTPFTWQAGWLYRVSPSS